MKMSEIFAAGYERIGTLSALKIKYIFLLSQCDFFPSFYVDGILFCRGTGSKFEHHTNFQDNITLIKIILNLFVFLKKKFNKKSIT